MPTSASPPPPLKKLGLFSLFPPGRIFLDTDGDGCPDRVSLFIGVPPRLDDRGMWAGILNLTARLAAEAVGLARPIVGPLGMAPSSGPSLLVYKPSPRHPAAAEMTRLAADRVALRGHSPATLAALLHTLAIGGSDPSSLFPDWAVVQSHARRPDRMRMLDRHGSCLAELRLRRPEATALRAQPGPTECDLLDVVRTFYHSPDDAPTTRSLRLSVELAAESVAPQLGLALSEVVARIVLEATEIALPVATVGAPPAGGITLRVSGPVRGPARIVRMDGPGSGVVLQLEGSPAASAGLLRRWLKIAFPEGPSGAPAARVRSAVAAVGACISRGADAAPDARMRAAGTRARTELRFRHGWSSETRRAMDCLRRLPPGKGSLDGMILVSKPVLQRRALASEARAMLRAKGYRCRLTVLNAYKPGLSWLLEAVLPRLKRTPALARAEVAYRPFAPDGSALEMKSRWLQEIFPGPDLLAAALGWPVETVRLAKRDDLADAYRVRAWDRRRRLVFEAGFSPRLTRFPYLPGRAMGVVHPTCGGIRLVRDGEVVLDQEIPTDRELFWRHFQSVWLPAMEALMRERVRSARAMTTPAFWEEARFDVAIDETDLRLGLGEERVAPMEALHEDLYFVLLDFFKVFAQKHGLPAAVSFGRIFPKVSAVAARGRPSARLRARPLTSMASAASEQTSTRSPVSSLAWTGGRLRIGIESGQQPPGSKHSRAVLADARARGYDLRRDPNGKGFELRRPMPRTAPGAAGRRGAVPAPPMDRLLGSSEVTDWVRRLGRLAHVGCWRAGSSWQRRPVWALEAALAGGGTASVARLRLLKPTLLLNARHHANEISSTNAALRLVWELAATGWGRRALRRVNVIVVPLENADGVATLEALLPGAEGHKLHAARYNALGVEWYADYFDPAPRFPEARVKPRLWRRWLPLIVLDAHGVPSHEWEQPFSGYAPVRFRQYWIPRAFIYTVVPFLDQPGHPGCGPARRLVRVMAEALRGDAEMDALNRELGRRYRRYARGPEPGVFPPGAAETLVALPAEARIANLNFAARRFPLTLSEIITEVTDEVVAGKLLRLCARGHLTVAKALIDFLSRHPPGRLMRKPLREGRLILSWESGLPRGRSAKSC